MIMTAQQNPWFVRSKERSEEHTSELQSPCKLVCRLLLEKKKREPILPRSHREDPSIPPRTARPTKGLVPCHSPLLPRPPLPSDTRLQARARPAARPPLAC